MRIAPLDKARHDRTSFDCGIPALNHYLKIMASQQSSKDNSRTFVLETDQPTHNIIGFYTLTMTLVDLSGLPPRLQKKHQSATSAGLIARLAIDQRHAGKRLGEGLLIDALKRLLQASDEIGFPLVIVDAKDGAHAFYQKYGFNPFQHQPNKLFMTIADIRKSMT